MDPHSSPFGLDLLLEFRCSIDHALIGRDRQCTRYGAGVGGQPTNLDLVAQLVDLVLELGGPGHQPASVPMVLAAGLRFQGLHDECLDSRDRFVIPRSLARLIKSSATYTVLRAIDSPSSSGTDGPFGIDPFDPPRTT